MNKPYSDSTLMSFTKNELIEHIRMLEYNYNALNEYYKRVCRILDKNKNNINFESEEK